MSVTVYGLRLRGSHEVRYIGQSKDVDARLAGHHASVSSGWMLNPLRVWLSENRDSIEWIEIDVVESREDARRIEREAVNFCLKLGHRLLNLHLVPRDKRIYGSVPAPERLRRTYSRSFNRPTPTKVA